MDFPFFKSDKEWQELRPKDIDSLGRRSDLDPEQARLLEVFRVVDLRVEWNCRLSIVHHNWMVVLTLLFVVIEGPKVISTVTAYLMK